MSIHEEYISKAIKESFKSNCTHKHGAIIVDGCTGKIITKGYNRLTDNQKHTLSIHAEIDALRKIRSCYTKYDNLVMYIIRFSSNKQELKYSKPCINCATNIIRFGIRRIYFSDQVDFTDKIIGYTKNNIKICSLNDVDKYFKKNPTFTDKIY
jgi:tRNA(Arg) A34 adenosine deaminase TadA